MSRYIITSKLIDKFNYFIDMHVDPFTAIELALDAVPSEKVEPIPTWNCVENPPKDSCDCWLCDAGGGIHHGRFDSLLGFVDLLGNEYFCKIKYWQKYNSPKPPKEFYNGK